MRAVSPTRCRPAATLVAAALATLLAAPVSPAAAQRPSSTAPPPEGWSRAPRWQAVLHDGAYLWEITPAALSGDTLVARQADTLVRVPLDRVDELRLLRASVKRVGNGARATFGGLAGADDDVYTLTRYPLAERRRIVARLLAEHPAGAPGAGRP